MSDADTADLALVVLRAAVGFVFLAHGWNHIFGGGKIRGTAGWFESLGMRPGIVHAWTASLIELSAGVLLILGLATPFAAAGVIGTMIVAWVTNHRTNGFFIFRPGEGYEYVLVLTIVGTALAGLGAGSWSIDHAIGWFDPPGWRGLFLAVLLGYGGAASLLALAWRPRAAASTEQD